MAMRSGFIGLIGRPNVGKSTIVNWFVGTKVTIVSPRPQTTRTRVLGILNKPDLQAIFVDSPGWHQPEHPLGKFMVSVAKGVLEEADVLVAVIDASTRLTVEDDRIFDHIRQAKRAKCILVINKVDLVNKRLVLPLIAKCAELNLFEEIVPVSALSGDNMDRLLDVLIARLPEGPQWYEPDQLTDQTNEQIIREFIREQATRATRQEVPHAIAVQLDTVEIKPPPPDEPYAKGLVVIQATLLVEREGQKAILIGKRGSALKQIGTAARLDLERWFKRKVFLELWVKVAENWRDNPRLLKELGYDG